MLNPPSLQNNTTNVVIQQNSRKLLMMDILMSETCRVHKKWNKIASDIKLVFYYSTITKMHSPINIRYNIYFSFTGSVYKRKKRKLEDKAICISRKIWRHKFWSLLHHKTASFAVWWCQLQSIQSALPPLTLHLQWWGEAMRWWTEESEIWFVLAEFIYYYNLSFILSVYNETWYKWL